MPTKYFRKEVVLKLLKERIQIEQNYYSIWFPMKKYNRITWKSTGKTQRAMAKDKAVELQG